MLFLRDGPVGKIGSGVGGGGVSGGADRRLSLGIAGVRYDNSGFQLPMLPAGGGNALSTSRSAATSHQSRFEFSYVLSRACLGKLLTLTKTLATISLWLSRACLDIPSIPHENAIKIAVFSTGAHPEQL